MSDKRIVPYEGEEGFIFISYAHRNSERVLPILERLQKEGFRVWYDEGIDPGTEWDDNIANHISNCGYFIAFMSGDYLASANCRDELYFARDKKKKMFLIYLEEVELPDGLKMRLGRIQNIHKYVYADEEAFYNKLFRADEIEEYRSNVEEEECYEEDYSEEEYYEEEEYDEEEEYEEYQRITPEEIKHATTCFDIAYNAESAGQRDRAVEYYKNAIEFLKPETSGPWSREEFSLLILCCNKVGYLLIASGDLESASHYFEITASWGDSFYIMQRREDVFLLDCLVECYAGLFSVLGVSTVKLMSDIKQGNIAADINNITLLVEKANRFLEYYEKFGSNLGEYQKRMRKEVTEALAQYNALIKQVLAFCQDEVTRLKGQ